MEVNKVVVPDSAITVTPTGITVRFVAPAAGTIRRISICGPGPSFGPPDFHLSTKDGLTRLTEQEKREWVEPKSLVVTLEL